MRLHLAFVALAAALALSACASVPTDPEERAEFDEVKDPLEPANRAVFDFNLALDKAVIKPVTQGYVAVVPAPGRSAVQHFLANLRTPLTLANDLAQGSPSRAGVTFSRFMINTTFGLGGLFDVAASEPALQLHESDFGQTMAIWGISDGPYLMLPLLGPSNPRDAVGIGVEYFADPLDIYLSAHGLDYLTWVRTGAEVIDTRSRLLDTLDTMERASLDYYATLRSVSRQHRDDQIHYRRPDRNP